MNDETALDAVTLAAELTVAWLGNHNTRTSADDVPAFLNKMHDTVSALMSGNTQEGEAVPAAPEFTPAVSVRKSLASKDHIISMIDGKPYKTLRRHLSTNGLSPDEYRTRFGLKKDYPMVSENYSASRREMAHKIGLGRKPGQKATSSGDKPVKAPRQSKAATAAKGQTGDHA